MMTNEQQKLLPKLKPALANVFVDGFSINMLLEDSDDIALFKKCVDRANQRAIASTFKVHDQ